MAKQILPGHLKSANEKTARRVESGHESMEARKQVSYKGADDLEKRIAALKGNIDAVEGEEFWSITYDIPEPIPNSPIPELTIRHPNPCGMFWRNGAFMLQLSQAVCRTSTLSNLRVVAQFAYWDRYCITYDLIPFHPAAVAGIKAIAQRKLDAFICGSHGSLIQTIAAADAALASVLNASEPTHNEVLGAVKGYAQRVRGRLREASMDLDAAIACAEEFDATEDVAHLIKAFRLALRAQQLAFNEMAEMNRVKPVAVVPEEGPIHPVAETEEVGV